MDDPHARRDQPLAQARHAAWAYYRLLHDAPDYLGEVVELFGRLDALLGFEDVPPPHNVTDIFDETAIELADRQASELEPRQLADEELPRSLAEERARLEVLHGGPTGLRRQLEQEHKCERARWQARHDVFAFAARWHLPTAPPMPPGHDVLWAAWLDWRESGVIVLETPAASHDVPNVRRRVIVDGKVLPWDPTLHDRRHLRELARDALGHPPTREEWASISDQAGLMEAEAGPWATMQRWQPDRAANAARLFLQLHHPLHPMSDYDIARALLADETVSSYELASSPQRQRVRDDTEMFVKLTRPAGL